MKTYIVYILTNKHNNCLYIGITNNLNRRIIEHKLGVIDGFSKKYNLTKLVYFEQFEYVENAINREKQLKHWNREWKIDLIKKLNPNLLDLYKKFFGEIDDEHKNDILNHYLEKQIKY